MHEVNECECCGFSNPVGGLKKYNRMPSNDVMLCQVCACSYIPHLVTESKFLAKSIAIITNLIRKDIAAKDVNITI
jgi:23S rRNA A1618 N6-methylase RlmF